MDESQRLLLDAAKGTANAAQAVTQHIQNRIEDSLKPFEGAARAMNDALLVCEMDGSVRSCNPAAGRMFGRTDLLDCAITDLFDHGGSTPMSPVALWHLIEHSSAWLPNADEPLRGRRMDGRLFWVEPSLTRLDWTDRTSSMLLIVRNIDPVVSLQHSARVARQRYQSVFNGAPDGILIEQDGTIKAANQAINRMLGYPPADLIGKSPDLLFPAQDHARQGMSPGHSHHPILASNRLGGRVSLAFTATAITWGDAGARLITLRDLSEMRRIEDHGMPYSNGIDLVCTFTPAFVITYANEAFHNFYGEGTMVGADLRTLLSEEEHDALLTSLSTLTPDTRSCRMQVPTQENGRVLVQDWIDHAVFDDGGQAVSYQRVGRDLSDALSSLVTIGTNA